MVSRRECGLLGVLIVMETNFCMQARRTTSYKCDNRIVTCQHHVRGWWVWFADLGWTIRHIVASLSREQARMQLAQLLMRPCINENELVPLFGVGL